MGTAQLIDHDGDGIADELSNGTWTAELNAGLGLCSVPATFSATHELEQLAAVGRHPRRQ